MTSGSGWLIQDIANEGSSSDGRSIRFRLTCTDGRKTNDLSFHCTEEFVPVLVARLIALAATAQDLRHSGSMQ
jgi:hypothetical protein